MYKIKFKIGAKEDKGKIKSAKEIKVSMTNTSKTMWLVLLTVIFSLEFPQRH